MTNEVEIRLRIIGFAGGGFVLAENSTDDPHVIRAVSSMDELVGATGQAIRDWHAETQRVDAAQLADENTKIVTPKKWWRAIK